MKNVSAVKDDAKDARESRVRGEGAKEPGGGNEPPSTFLH